VPTAGAVKAYADTKQAASTNLTTFAGVTPSENAQTLMGHTFSQMLSDIGAQPALPTPSAGQLLVGNAGGTAYAAQAVSGDAAMTSAGVVMVTGTRSTSPFSFGTRAPGLNTPFNYFQAFGASTSWPLSAGGIYNAGAVDQFLVLGGYLYGGTYAAPTFYANAGAGVLKYNGTTGTFQIGWLPAGTGGTATYPLTISSAGVGVTSGTVGHAACIKTGGVIGYCSTVVASDGT